MPNVWKMFVYCILLNQTTYKHVQKVEEELFRKYHCSFDMSEADPSDLAEIIRPCGLQNRRAKSLINFSRSWLDNKHGDEVQNHPGIGQYAEDSYRIFALNDYSVKPTDLKLLAYLDFIDSVE